MAAASDLPSVGQRVREERLRRGVSLRALAGEVGVSASLVSQIETGKSQPSVSTLYAITSALGIAVEYVFAARGVDPAAGPGPPSRSDGEPDHRAGGAPGGRAPDGAGASPAVGTSLLDVLGSARGHRVGPLVRPAERQVLPLDSGVTWERLGHLPDTHVDFLLITYEPGGSSS